MITFSDITGDAPDAVLEIQLPRTVAAQELQALLALTQYVYQSHVWLGLAENQPKGEPMPDEDFVPSPEDRLWIEHLAIGTPNKLTLKGRAAGITAVATLLSTLVGLPMSGTQLYKTFVEVQEAKAEVAQKIAQTELLKQQLRQAERLELEGKITATSRQDKERTADLLSHYYPFAAPLLIPQRFETKSADASSDSGDRSN